MSGDVTLSLGPHRFTVDSLIYERMVEEIEGRWKEHYTAGGGHIDQFLGANSAPITITGVIIPLHYGGEGELDAVQQTIKAGKPVKFYSSGGKPFGNVKILYWRKSREEIGPDDVTIVASYEVRVSRYGGTVDRNPLTGLFSTAANVIRSLF